MVTGGLGPEIAAGDVTILFCNNRSKGIHQTEGGQTARRAPEVRLTDITMNSVQWPGLGGGVGKPVAFM